MTQRLVSAPSSHAFSFGQHQTRIFRGLGGGIRESPSLAVVPIKSVSQIPPSSVLGTAHVALVSSNSLCILEWRGK